MFFCGVLIYLSNLLVCISSLDAKIVPFDLFFVVWYRLKCAFPCLLPYQFMMKLHLTHWGRVTHICVSKITIIGPDNGSTPSRRWNFVNLNLRNKLKWNFNRNQYIFVQENAFEYVVWKTAAILPRPPCVNRAVFAFLWLSPSQLCAPHVSESNSD